MVDIGRGKNNFTAIYLNLHLIFQDFSAKRYPVLYTQFEKKKKFRGCLNSSRFFPVTNYSGYRSNHDKLFNI